MNIDSTVFEKAIPSDTTVWSPILMLILCAFIFFGVSLLYTKSKNNPKIAPKNRNINNVNINKLVAKIICMLGGIVGASIGAYTIYSEKQELFGYNYESPLSDHEIGVVLLIVISVFVFIVGAAISSYND